MGVLNFTPDSFSGDGRFNPHKSGKVNRQAALRFARKLIREGADILDIGGESTRPGSNGISLKEEIQRVVPVVEALARQSKVPISVDTYKMEVACRALDAGACIVNNIKGGRQNTRFLKMVRDYRAVLVVMHMRGDPSTMQKYTRYKDLVADVIKEIQISVEKCLAIGIKKERLIIDPGFGFAKSFEQNLMLIDRLEEFNVLRLPILVGTSRKSFIGKILDQDVKGRLMGTAASVVAGVMKGAHIVRVHDVAAIKDTLKVTDAILNAHP